MSDHGQSGELLESEEAIIRHFVPLAAAAAGAFALQDDCALLAPPAGCDLVLKTDPIAEGVHFLVGEEPQDVGWKALAVNVSDLAAKGAAPAHYLLALSFPTAPRLSWVQGFAAGLRTAQDRFGCQLIGGDTDRRPGPVTIAITLIGTVPQGRMVRRGTARAGDGLFVSGTLGDAALGLALLREPRRAAAWGLSVDMVEHLKHRYRRPQPRLALAGALREHASAAMDLSDGLAKDLARLCRASGCAGQVRMADLPLSPSAASTVAADRSQYEAVLAGGDDYEILASVPPQGEAAFQRASAAAGIAVTRIGSLTGGSGISIETEDGGRLDLARSGWDHFATRCPGTDRG
jgi:thiamine-monophosphate kinase